MNRNSNRPIIDIQRICWVKSRLRRLRRFTAGFSEQSTAKSSDGTFANRKKQHYNDSIKMIWEEKKKMTQQN